MKLFIDNREPKDLINLFQCRLKNVYLENLDIGDFIIKNDNDDIIMVFERKSLSDLIASIKDGRYTEQSFRLSQFPLNNHNIYYIIEGNLSNFCLKNPEPMQKMVFSSMLSLSYKKGFSLLHTSDLSETAEFIIRFIEKLESEKKITSHVENGEHLDNIQKPVYTNVLKASKKSNITRENIGEIMLSQIPGLSMPVAQAIMQKYKSIKELINALSIDNKCLDTFTIQHKNGQRKINKPVIKHLLEYLDII